MRHASSPARKLHYSLINTLPKYLSHTKMCWCEKICALIPSLGDLFENHLHAEPCRAAREEQRMVAPDDPQPPPAGLLLPVCSAHCFCTFCLLILLIQKLVCSPETSQMVQEGFRLNNEGEFVLESEPHSAGRPCLFLPCVVTCWFSEGMWHSLMKWQPLNAELNWVSWII